MLELGSHTPSQDDFKCGYRSVHPFPPKYTFSLFRIPNTPPSIYISGDTLLVPDLSEIPKRYPNIDLLLIHLGGTTIPSPSMPLLMVTMDAEQGVKLVQMVKPDVTIPVHYEYVFPSFFPTVEWDLGFGLARTAWLCLLEGRPYPLLLVALMLSR